jgi:hypothetical protein
MKAINFDICEAMGVTENTLRGWRTDLRQSTIPDLDARLDIARKAGQLASRLERDPDFGTGEAIDAAVMHLMQELRDVEPLASFGARYRREFGSVKGQKLRL